MAKNSSSSQTGISTLFVVSKIEKEQAKLVNINKPTQKSGMLLPPPLENYIKTKKHDFF